MHQTAAQPAYLRALTQLLAGRERQFWVLQTAGWALYFAAAWVSAMTYDKPTPYYDVILGAAVSGFLLTIPLRYAYRRLWVAAPARAPTSSSAGAGSTLGSSTTRGCRKNGSAR